MSSPAMETTQQRSVSASARFGAAAWSSATCTHEWRIGVRTGVGSRIPTRGGVNR
jgi:hypothetical protein